MEQQEVAVQPTVKVVLASTSHVLDELVVVGYGVQRRSSFTGALSTVGTEKIQALPVASLDEALKGNVPGLTANTGTGQPGADTKIIIRGVGSINAGTNPLYIVDGVPITTGNWTTVADNADDSYNGSVMGAMANINPNDIESLSVLKDATATAIYGARAANGVIVIKTKQGRQGKTQFNFTAQAGLSSLANTGFKMLNSSQYIDLMTESYRNSGYSEERIAEEFAKFPKDANGNYYDTDWRKEAYRSNALTQSYDLSASGGNEKTDFYVSISRYSQESITKWGSMDRTSVRLNLNHRAYKWLSFGGNMAYSLSDQDTPLTTAAYYSNPVAGSINLVPLNPVRNLDGTYYDSPIGNNGINFVQVNDQNTSTTKTHRLIASGYGQINFTDNLFFKTLYGYDLMILDDDQYDDPRSPGNTAFGKGRATRTNRSVQVWNWTNTLNFDKTFLGVHNLNLLAGQEAQAQNTYRLTTAVEGFASYKLRQPSAGATPSGYDGYEQNSRMVSFFGQASYNYDFRYFLSASFRYDGSSKFGKNHLFAPFWSIGATWDISREAFMKDTEWLNQFRIRSSYGTTGNSDIGYYNSYGLYSFNSYNNANASYPSQMANPELTWETVSSFNVGLDFRVMNRFGGTIEFYNKKTSDMLLEVPLSRTTGFETQWRNIGDMRNRGVEISVNLDLISNADFLWRLDANWAKNKNKVLKLSRPDEEIDWGASDRKLIREGEDMMQFKLVEYAGVNPADGAQMWYDRDGELVFTRSYANHAKTGVGSAAPKGQGGITNTLSYKGFDLSFFFFFQYGNKIFDNVAYQYQNDGSKSTNNEITDMLDRWQKPGDVSKNPKRSITTTTQVSTRYLYDGSYIRLRNAKLGYTVPQNITNKFHVSNLRFFVQGQNLFTITKYPGVDPDAPWDGEAFYAFPTSKTWTFGVDVKF
ncbi:TonB-linked SusC/RagA family outer membrane protein [Parabacteroides sp. PF5-5]|nr:MULTISPECIES: TonB-dependent receptor [unclassified Parabacteroides]MDH6304436.1 TonB-linked SusC/RagA family outer membrane protein [Parabacteroides sp. PH5-39]MDH6315411.1 TonB-linked SusC/RagA family outer membrane protein [Parabacteroides sp. PF5-13]MDH6319095.1 TonB-linked SusC/RagA family outer membrane protein [Parabacteroides sp. PH5-13]MDH6326603.1 TonB-linked SusC/RagA family outer membrane protein [Parabacteroides sp. PH5-41]MDH6334427.1 TonB-linked SusC/RagA family outer membran